MKTPPSTSTPAAGQIGSLSGLRGAAALTVVVSHAANFGLLPASLGDGAGGLGVMLFFAISGFLMAHLYFPRTFSRAGVLRYAGARVARVYPLYLAVVVGSYLLGAAWSGFPYQFTTDMAVRHVLLYGDYNVFWTISAEFQFYLCFLLLWFLRQLPRSQRVGNTLMAAALVGAIATMHATGLGVDGRIELGHNLMFFAAGIFAAIGFQRSGALQRVGPMLFLAAAVGYFLLYPQIWELLFGVRHGQYSSLGVAAWMGLLVYACAAAESSRVGRVLGARVMRWLGDLSFSVYLLHWPVLKLTTDLLDTTTSAPARVLAFLAALGAILLLSQLSFRRLEVPARGWINGIARRRADVLARPSTNRAPLQ